MFDNPLLAYSSVLRFQLPWQACSIPGNDEPVMVTEDTAPASTASGIPETSRVLAPFIHDVTQAEKCSIRHITVCAGKCAGHRSGGQPRTACALDVSEQTAVAGPAVFIRRGGGGGGRQQGHDSRRHRREPTVRSCPPQVVLPSNIAWRPSRQPRECCIRGGRVTSFFNVQSCSTSLMRRVRRLVTY